MTENGSLNNYGHCVKEAYSEILLQIPEIRSATRIYNGWDVFAEYEKTRYYNLDMLFADKDFFDVFGLSLISGNVADALQGANKLILSESIAKKIFGTIPKRIFFYTSFEN